MKYHQLSRHTQHRVHIINIQIKSNLNANFFDKTPSFLPSLPREHVTQFGCYIIFHRILTLPNHTWIIELSELFTFVYSTIMMMREMVFRSIACDDYLIPSCMQSASGYTQNVP